MPPMDRFDQCSRSSIDGWLPTRPRGVRVLPSHASSRPMDSVQAGTPLVLAVGGATTL